MWDDYQEGLHVGWKFSFSSKDMELFSQLSNDFNPIHTNINFAKSKGFEGPIVYGLLLSSQMSRLVGEELPDNNSILTSIRMDFLNPCFPEEELLFGSYLINKSNAMYALDFSCYIARGDNKLCRGAVSAIWRG